MQTKKTTKKTGSASKKAVKSSIVRVSTKESTEQASALPTLTREEDVVFAEALRQGENARGVLESALLNYGRWLLAQVFGDDTTAALEHRADNPIWQHLQARAGGKSLRLSKRFLVVAVTIAAYDKRISSDSWRLLEPTRKELLLPLKDEKLLRSASAHVIDAGLSHRATRKYVETLRQEQGEAPARRVTGPRFRSLLENFRERVADRSFQRSLQSAVKSLDNNDKRALQEELRALMDTLGALKKRLD